MGHCLAEGAPRLCRPEGVNQVPVCTPGARPGLPWPQKPCPQQKTPAAHPANPKAPPAHKEGNSGLSELSTAG